MPVTAYEPSSLSEIDSVEVIVLNGSSDSMWARGRSSAATGTLFFGEVAQRIAALWRALPPGSQRRCHIPPFGLRFRREELVVCSASICWECHNVHGSSAGADWTYEFEANAAVSRELLRVLGEMMGRVEEG